MDGSTKEFSIATAVSLSATSSSPGIDVSQYNSGAVQATYNYSSGTSAGTATIDWSNDGTNFMPDPDSSLAFSAVMSPTNNLWNITKFAAKYLRVTHNNTSGSGGTVTINFFGKTA